jgi:PAS domain S-box-containing protein
MNSTLEYNIVLIAIIVVSLFIAVITARRRTMQGARSLVILSLIVAIWSGAYLHPPIARGPGVTILASLIYFCVLASATALLTFSLSYNNRSHWLTRPALGLLAVLPLVTQLIIWMEPWRNVFFTDAMFGVSGRVLQGGMWSNLVFFYSYNMEAISLLLFFDTFTRKPTRYLFQSGIAFLGVVAPLFARLASHVEILSVGRLENIHIGYAFTVLGFAYTLHYGKKVEIIPLTRDAVVEGMSDGWMVLDTTDRIIDINPIAESIIGLSRSKVYGRPVGTVLTDWPGLSDAAGGVKELDMRRSIRTRTDWRYLNIRLSNLRNRNNDLVGKLILWRDITERRLADDARQRARDEMFAILNAISNAATHTANLDDFLSEAIFQIIHPFRSQVAAIWLLEDNELDAGKITLHLASQFGLTPEAIQRMAEVRILPSVFDMAVNQRRTLLIDDIPDEVRINYAMRGIGISTFVLLPLKTTQSRGEKLTLGCMALARKDQSLFSQDEIIRLQTIMDQLATLIDSDRRRQLSIARLERQRLLRDLHDSVSQKLYGLVALTEAAQAALEAGSSVMPEEVLKKIGDNARMAVKEMRLFLYEMQPVELEEEGLVSVLHHRLAAVEGRADIKARLLADDNISIPKETEVALYYVAQEALNNILRHAHAASVTVRLRKTRQHIVLEVEDDGRGFDLKKLEPGGMGLKGMRERVALIHGRIEIQSKVENGTKIKVTVDRERLFIQKARRKKQ